ncbi:hypothetical protein P4S72_03460 [Vibrio sp. PP-XX7]
MPEKMITQKLDFFLFGEMTDQQALDIIRIRKTNAKKIPVTQNVLNMLAKEFQKAGQQFGLSLQDCLDEWEYRGWRVLKPNGLGTRCRVRRYGQNCRIFTVAIRAGLTVWCWEVSNEKWNRTGSEYSAGQPYSTEAYSKGLYSKELYSKGSSDRFP